MSHAPVLKMVLSLLPCLIPPYALRLNRLFGTQRVGWMLFAVFSLLALLELVRSWHPMGVGMDAGLTLDLLNVFVPVLLLIGMVHIEILFKERLQLEVEERHLRQALQLQVKDRTADLDKTNEELQQEISLRRQGEEELRKSKEQYRFLFDENPQPMWIFDLNSFRFLAFNTATLRHYGYGSEEFRELTAKDLFVAGEAESFAADGIQGSTGVPTRRLWRHCKKDGAIIEVELIALDLVYGGCPARLVLTNDVTAQRLLQKQLLQAQKMEVTSQLAGGVADNFNRLIAVIEGEATVQVQTCQDVAAAEALKRIAATAAGAAGLTRQLLALVRRHPMRLQALDLNKLIENQAGVLGRLMGNKITIQKSFWPNLPPIMADPSLVEQIVRNLALNARDAMPKGGVLGLWTAAVRVEESHARTVEDARAGTYVCLSVADNGCGMTPDIQARLFDPFFTTKQPGKATGLGLATVHGLIKQHSGWIEVNSQPGAGSQFAVFLPCAPAVASRKPAAGLVAVPDASAACDPEPVTG